MGLYKRDDGKLVHEHNGHVYTAAGWWCEVHNRGCAPFKPVTMADVVERAAKDESLDDGAFSVLSRVLRGDKL